MVYLHLPYFIPELIEVTDERTTDLDCAYDTEDAFKFLKRIEKGIIR